MSEPTAEDLMILIADLYGRKGVNQAFYACEHYMEPEDVELLHYAIDTGQKLARGRASMNQDGHTYD